MSELLLASGSPRRAELIGQLGIAFRIFRPEIDESIREGERALDYVRRMSHEKAYVARSELAGATALLCADTIVVIDDKILGKPAGREEATSMLEMLSGRSHRVITSVTISNQEREVTFESETIVKFRQLSKRDMEHYWATGEPIDKAGAYGIQGLGAVFVESIEGSYSNVVGLPLMETAQTLEEFGIDCLELAGACGNSLHEREES
jgi:septum formation protein